MESEPEQQVDDEFPEIDFRIVTILWHEGAVDPEVTYTACSIFEAIGMTDRALDNLRERGRIPQPDEDTDDYT